MSFAGKTSGGVPKTLLVDSGGILSTLSTVGTSASGLGKAAVTGISYGSGDVGVSMLAVRRDAIGQADFGADGKYAPLTITSSGALACTIAGDYSEENAGANESLVEVAGRYDETPRVLDDGDAGGLAITAAGHVLTSTVVTSSTLPTDAATETTLSTLSTTATNIEAGVTNVSTAVAANQAAVETVKTSIENAQADLGALGTATKAVIIQGDTNMTPVVTITGNRTLVGTQGNIVSAATVTTGTATAYVDCSAMGYGSLFIEDTSTGITETTWGVQVIFDDTPGNAHPLFDSGGVDIMSLPRVAFNGVMYAQIIGLNLTGIVRLAIYNNHTADILGVTASLTGTSL